MLQNNNPLISVFIPYYNDKNFLKEAIESVLNQTYENFELILLNHATTDCCREIAHSYKDERIKHIDMPYNLGYGGSGLLAQEFLKLARGKYVKFFCADDVMLKDCLKKLVNYMENNPEIDFAFGDCEYINEKNKDLKTSFFENRDKFNIKNTEEDCIRLYARGCSFLPWIGSVIKREILHNVEINVTFLMMFDMSLWLALLCKGYKIGFLNDIIANYRIHKNQLSAIENEQKAMHVSIYEAVAFYKIFLSIDDIGLVKRVWNKSPLIEHLTKSQDIPFVVSRELLQNYPVAYSYLTDLLNNSETREYLQKTFNYGIRELREDIYHLYKKKNEQKGKIYSKKPKELSFFNLLYLMFRKIFNILTFKFVKIRKKKYSA